MDCKSLTFLINKLALISIKLAKYKAHSMKEMA